MAITIKNPNVEGYAGINRVRFTGTTRYGRGRTDVEVEVPGEVIRRLAECLKATDGHCGHAVWHFHNPERPMPCETCKT